jgi:putative salt-induced outer membrane protein YdiY
MNTHTTCLLRLGVCVALLCALRLSADVIMTTDGARIVGKIKQIHGGVITLSTDYAGDISIKQALVTSITTDHPIAVRTADGTRVIGVVSPTQGGAVSVVGPRGSAATPISKIAASWAAGQEDPDVVASRRKWSYEAGVDINGQSGTNNQLSTDYGFKATLTGPNDLLKLYTAYNRQSTDSVVSTSQFKVGADYSDNFTTYESWYVKDEGGFDRVNDILFYDIAAAGFGYDFVKTDNQTLTGRAGLSYRYDEYALGTGTPTLSEPGADLGFVYTHKFKTSLLSDEFSFDPTFADPSTFVINHEIKYDIPLANPFWKLSLGMSNSYNSKPVGGVEKLDTLYFARLVLTWGVVAPAGP